MGLRSRNREAFRSTTLGDSAPRRIRHIHFTNEGEGQSLTCDGQSRKRVPIHRTLEKLGFLQYVSKAKASGAESASSRTSSRTVRAICRAVGQKWFNRYLDNRVGIKRSLKGLSLVRHAFKARATSRNSGGHSQRADGAQECKRGSDIWERKGLSAGADGAYDARLKVPSKIPPRRYE